METILSKLIFLTTTTQGSQLHLLAFLSEGLWWLGDEVLSHLFGLIAIYSVLAMLGLHNNYNQAEHLPSRHPK